MNQTLVNLNESCVLGSITFEKKLIVATHFIFGLQEYSFGGSVRKLTDYVEVAATEYWQDTGKGELDSFWIAEFFQDSGVLDDYPKQDLVGFFALVQKALTIKVEQAEKLARLQQEKSGRPQEQLRKPES